MRTPLALLASGCLLVCWLQAGAEPTRIQNLASPSAPNVVTDWALIAQNTIAPPPPAAPLVFLSGQLVHSPLAHIAMYDAAVAIKGGYRPYTDPVKAPADADLAAAVATAAFRVLHERFPSRQAYVQSEYDNYMANIPDGQAKVRGIDVGNTVASQLLAMRMDDGLETCTGACSSNYVQPSPGPGVPGVFEPFPAGSTPAGASLGAVRPWTMSRPDQFRPNGPSPLKSRKYAKDWIETRDWGGRTSTLRSANDDDTARFWASQGYYQFRETFEKAAIDHKLDVVETGRLFAMGFTASADGNIGCYDAKYHYLFWRPQHAIPLADIDGNKATGPADPTWLPFLPTPNHPEYPSAHLCSSSAAYGALRAFFGGDTQITIAAIGAPCAPGTSPPCPVGTSPRTYTSFEDIENEIIDARVVGGMHFRHSNMDGAQLGRKVAKNLVKNYFQKLECGRRPQPGDDRCPGARAGSN